METTISRLKQSIGEYDCKITRDVTRLYADDFMTRIIKVTETLNPQAVTGADTVVQFWTIYKMLFSNSFNKFCNSAPADSQVAQNLLYAEIKHNRLWHEWYLREDPQLPDELKQKKAEAVVVDGKAEAEPQNEKQHDDIFSLLEEMNTKVNKDFLGKIPPYFKKNYTVRFKLFSEIMERDYCFLPLINTIGLVGIYAVMNISYGIVPNNRGAYKPRKKQKRT